jgi:hypothetical protein
MCVPLQLIKQRKDFMIIKNMLYKNGKKLLRPDYEQMDNT